MKQEDREEEEEKEKSMPDKQMTELTRVQWFLELVGLFVCKYSTHSGQGRKLVYFEREKEKYSKSILLL